MGQRNFIGQLAPDHHGALEAFGSDYRASDLLLAAIYQRFHERRHNLALVDAEKILTGMYNAIDYFVEQYGRPIYAPTERKTP